MTYRHSKDATVAAAKSGFSRATGYRIEDDPRRQIFLSIAVQIAECRRETIAAMLARRAPERPQRRPSCPLASCSKKNTAGRQVGSGQCSTAECPLSGEQQKTFARFEFFRLGPFSDIHE
jgi:hypothetical protein